MTTIVTALNRIARQCGVKAPSSWVTATRDDHVEIRDDFLLETVDDCLDRVDWPSPLGKQQTLTGTGTTNADGSETFSLASNFVRLQRDDLAVYDQRQDRAVVPVTTDGDWTNLVDLGASGVIKAYRIQGYEGNWTMDVYLPPGSGDTLTVSYISDVWMKSSGGTEGSMFTDEDDVLLLPRRLIETGAVWRFRERRGLPYQDKWNEYEILMQRYVNDFRGRRSINFGEAREYRWQDIVPAFIPSS